MSPVRAESRQLLESPRRKLRSVCKTPYRVLDAPELADDFYLNLVDWSSTNVLGVGLGSAVYLWAAHTAAVSKLCDLSTSNDTISSVAWAQKVRDRPPLLYAVTDSCLNLGIDTGGWYTRRSPPHLRRQHPRAPADLQPGPQPADWRHIVEPVRSELGLSGSDDLSPGHPGKGHETF